MEGFVFVPVESDVVIFSKLRQETGDLSMGDLVCGELWRNQWPFVPKSSVLYPK